MAGGEQDEGASKPSLFDTLRAMRGGPGGWLAARSAVALDRVGRRHFWRAHDHAERTAYSEDQPGSDPFADPVLDPDREADLTADFITGSKVALRMAAHGRALGSHRAAAALLVAVEQDDTADAPAWPDHDERSAPERLTVVPPPPELLLLAPQAPPAVAGVAA